GAIDFATLEQRPGVGIGISGVNSSDEARGQATLGLKAVEGLEGRGREHTAKIPNHRLYGHAFVLPRFEASRCRTCAAPIVTGVSSDASRRDRLLPTSLA